MELFQPLTSPPTQSLQGSPLLFFALLLLKLPQALESPTDFGLQALRGSTGVS